MSASCTQSKSLTETVRSMATSLFRRTAANLLRLNQNGESKEYAQFQRNRVEAVSESLHRRFSRLASPNFDEIDRRNQLQAIVLKVAKLGVTLLLQPETYEFHWSMRLKHTSTGSSSADHQRLQSRRDWRFMIFPALCKTSDDAGQLLRRPEIICKPEFMDEE